MLFSTRVVTVAAAALAMTVGSVAQAQPHRPRGPGGPGGGPGGGMGRMFNPEMIERVAVEIGVNDATVKKIKDDVYKAQKDVIGLKSEHDQAALELKRIMDGDSPSVSKALSQVEVVGRLETKIKQNRIRLMLTVRARLSKEQRDKLQTLMRERAQGRRGRGPWGGPGGKGPGGRGPGGPRGPR